MERQSAWIGAGFMSALPYRDLVRSPAFEAACAGRFTAEPRHVEGLGGQRYRLTMRAAAPCGAKCVKTVMIDPAPPPGGKVVTATVHLHSNAQHVTLDGTYLTEMRTAACAARAALGLARRPVRGLVVGTGALSPEFMRAYIELLGLEHLHIWGRDRTRADAIARAAAPLAARAGVVTSSVAPDDLKAAMQAADVIATVTSATSPLVDEAVRLKTHSHLGLVGSWQASQCEVHPLLLSGAQIFVDTAEAIDTSGELAGAIAAGVVDRSSVKLIGALPPEGEGIACRSVFKSVGNAVFDLAAALHVSDCHRRAAGATL